MAVAFLFIMVLAMLAAGVPVAISLGLSSVLHILFFGHDSMSSIALKFFESTGHYTLLAIPFFIISSNFMSTGGVAQRIVRLAIATVGQFRGGMAIAGVFACMLFAALSGSSPATVVAVGSIVIGGMLKTGYTRSFAVGVISGSGTLGILIPPSIVMVVYAAATNVSVGRMFMAGVIPGILAGLMLMAAIWFVAGARNFPKVPFPGWGEVSAAVLDAGWGLFLIVIILGGIYGGIFTPTEAAAVAAVYAFLIANLVYRDIGPLQGRTRPGAMALLMAAVQSPVHPDNRRVMVTSARTTIMLMFIIVNALLFAHVLTTERIPQIITGAIIGAGLEWWSFLILVNLLLLAGGQFMEPSGLLLIIAPVVFPVAIELGIDPIHLGIIMVVNMEIGMITPPIGLNLFVSSAITGMPLFQVVRAAFPWMMILLLFLVIVTYVPPISTWLPTLLMGPEVIIR